MTSEKIIVRLTPSAGKGHVVRIFSDNARGRARAEVVAAQASSVVLRNVVPVKAGSKTCLKGELVAWEGRIAKNLPEDIRTAVEACRLPGMFNTHAHYRKILSTGPRLVTQDGHPGCFFESSGFEASPMEFMKARFVAVSGARITAADVVFRAAGESRNTSSQPVACTRRKTARKPPSPGGTSPSWH